MVAPINIFPSLLTFIDGVRKLQLLSGHIIGIGLCSHVRVVEQDNIANSSIPGRNEGNAPLASIM